MTILIVTHQRGFESDVVIDRLRTLGFPFFRLNQDDGPSVSQFSFLSTNDERKVLLSSDSRTIELNGIRCVWFQQPPPFTGQPSDIEQTLQRNNLGTFLEASFELLTAKWLNKPSNVLRASNKVLQLHYASNMGLQIPETCISNDPGIVRAFCSKGLTIVKNLNSPWIAQDDGTIISYTELVQDEWIQDDQSVIFCPLIYQRFVERKHDYRVVILGKDVFVSRCDSEKGDIVDVRRNNETGSNFYEHSIDVSQIIKLRKLMQVFGVDYCSADFIEDKSGNVLFLEMNLCGAWWWMDKIFEGKILNAFVQYLTR